METPVGLYAKNKTDKELETKGIELDYGDYKITIARAGGANSKYAKTHEKVLKPFRRQLDNNLLSEFKIKELLSEVYAEAVILNWVTLDEETSEYVKGIESEDGSLIEFNKANVKQTLLNLPEVFQDIVKDASNHELFLASIREVAAENLKKS